MKFKKIFVTVGTTRFDELCNEILQNETLRLFKSLGCENLIMQIGKSENYPENYDDDGIDVQIYSFKDNIVEDMKNSDLIISHAGAGTCLEVLDIGKPLLVVINTHLMNNHQTEIAEQLQIDGYLYHCTCESLHSTLRTVNFSKLKSYPKADSTPLFQHLDEILGFAK